MKPSYKAAAAGLSALAAILVTGLFFVGDVHTQTPCHLFTSSNPVPEGFGAAYNPLSTARKLLLNASCITEGAKLTIGSSQNLWQLQGFRHGSPPVPGRNTGDGAMGADIGGKGIDDPALPENKPLPSPKNSTVVSNASQLTVAINAASPGDHIILQNGSYGNFTISRDFPADNRLVIKAQNLLGAKFTTLHIAGSGVIISGVAVDTGIRADDPRHDYAIRVNAENVRVTRCTAKNAMSVFYVDRGKNILVDHCELSHYTWRGIFVRHHARNVIIAKNHIHSGLDGTTHKSNKSFGGTADGLLSAVAIGSAHTSERRAHVGGIVRYNYFEKHGTRGNPVVHDYIHNKTSSNTYAFNMFIKAPGTRNQVSNRFGTNVRFIGNNADRNDITLVDYDNVAIGNRGIVRVYAGNSSLFSETWDAAAWDGDTSKKRYTSIQFAARRAKVASNDGPAVQVGWLGAGMCNLDPTPTDGVEVYDQDITYFEIPSSYSGKCVGMVTYKNVKHFPNQQPPASWGPVPKPINFSVGAVGPHAPSKRRKRPDGVVCNAAGNTATTPFSLDFTYSRARC